MNVRANLHLLGQLNTFLTSSLSPQVTNATMITFVGSQFTNDDDEATLQVRVGLDVLDWPSIKGSDIW